MTKTILFLAANPHSTTHLRLDQEARAIEAALRRAAQREQFTFIAKWAVRPEDLRRALLELQPQIVHFSGHGVADEGIVLEDATGAPIVVSTDALRQFFALFPQVECVILNACYTDTQAEAIAETVPAVIGMRQAAGDSAAKTFSIGFYDALGAGQTIEFAYQLACNALALAGVPDQLSPVLLARPVSNRVPQFEVVAAPFKGLQYFDVGDAPLFFGREQLVKELVGHLGQHTFLAVIGASGSGKSSVVRAGLIPALQAGESFGEPVNGVKSSRHWHVHILTPTATPLESLALSLTRNSQSVLATSTLLNDLQQDTRTLHLYARRLCAPNQRLLLVIDQFEELFTLCKAREMRMRFIDQLLTAAQAEGVTTVIIALRADFYGHCANHVGLRQAIERKQKFIGAMGREELRRAIEEPAKRNGWQFEEGLVDELLNDIGATPYQQPEPGALPLLSHALLETWLRRERNLLTFRGYRAAGAVQGAIAKTAESFFLQLATPSQQEIARTVFLNLTEFSAEANVTRRRVKLAELISPSQEEAAVNVVLTQLAAARLVTLSTDEVEVAHEALIREWPRLREWLTDNQENLHTRRRLTQAAKEYNESGKDQELLYRGERLSQALAWVAHYAQWLNENELGFIEASQAAQQAQLRAKRRQTFALLAILGIALTLATAAAIFGLQSTQRRQEILSRDLAGDARRLLMDDPELSLMLAQQALSITHTSEAEEVLRQALQQSRVRQTHFYSSTNLTVVDFTADQILFATANDRGQIVIREAATGQQRYSVLDNSVPIRTLQFSPTEPHLLATSDMSGTLQIWNIMSGGSPFHPYEMGQPALSLAFRPDGEALFVSFRPAIWIWEMRQGQFRELWPLADVTQMVFSPDARTLIAATETGEIRFWDFQQAREIRGWPGHREAITALAISDDGLWLATAGADEIVRVWAVADTTNRPRFEFPGHASVVWMLRFSPDGTCLASAGQDETAYVWPLTTQDAPIRLAGHQQLVLGVSFPKNASASVAGSCGDQLVTVTNAGTLRHWAIDAAFEYQGWQLGASPLQSLALAPDGKMIIAAGDQGLIQQIDRSTGQYQTILTLPTRINDVAFNPQGDRLAVASAGGRAQMVDLMTQKLLTLPIAADSVFAVDFRPPDGQQVATGDSTGAIHLWDSYTGQRVPELAFATHHGAVNSLAFSHTGTDLLSGGADGELRWWTLQTNQPISYQLSLRADNAVRGALNHNSVWLAGGDANGNLQIFRQGTASAQIAKLHRGPIYALTFSADGQQLATGGADGQIGIWHVTEQRLLQVIQSTIGQVSDLAFLNTLDGDAVAATGTDGTLRFYLLHWEDLHRFAQQRITRPWTQDECQRYLVQLPCPTPPADSAE
jgi:WD40 repeat protein/energy-coupling factor transporter ATP-binding protein EcfA2